MAPDVLRRTPHNAGVLDRTGIISASMPSLGPEPDVPDDAYRPRPYRSRIFSLATVVLMLAVVMIGWSDRDHRRTEVARDVVDGVDGIDDVEGSSDVEDAERVPIASRPHVPPPVLHAPEHGAPEHGAPERGVPEREAVDAPEPSSAPDVRLTGSNELSVDPPSPTAVPSEMGLPSRDREHVSVEVLREDHSESPTSTRPPGDTERGQPDVVPGLSVPMPFASTTPRPSYGEFLYEEFERWHATRAEQQDGKQRDLHRRERYSCYSESREQGGSGENRGNSQVASDFPQVPTGLIFCDK